MAPGDLTCHYRLSPYSCRGVNRVRMAPLIDELLDSIGHLLKSLLYMFWVL